MQKNSTSLANYLNKKLRVLSFGMTAALTVIIGLFVGIGFFVAESYHQLNLLNALKNNVVTLAQNSDYRELERVLGSFSDSMPGTEIVVVREGFVQVSVPNMQKAQLPYATGRIYRFFGLEVTDGGMIRTELNLNDNFSGQNFGKVILNSPVRGPLSKAAWVMFLSCLFISILSLIWRRYTEMTLKNALRPLKKLQSDIYEVGNGRSPKTNPAEFEIREFAEIESLIHVQHADIRVLTEKAAQAEGEKRVQESVKSLLHDLLNPYTAMSNLSQAHIMYPDNSEIEKEFREKWPLLNKQIVNLLKSSRYMEIERPKLAVQNLLSTVEDGAVVGALKCPTSLRILSRERDEGPINLKHDPNLLGRAVANLVRNSVEEGATCVEVWCDRSPLTINIRDNGPGISRDRLALLYEGRIESKKPHGSGIGFKTAMRLVQAHAGNIFYEDSETGGAHFKIDLSTMGAQV